MLKVSTRSARRTGAAWLAAAAALAIGLGAPNARANGRYPKADQIVVAADHPEFIAVRTTFGVLLSRDSCPAMTPSIGPNTRYPSTPS